MAIDLLRVVKRVRVERGIIDTFLLFSAERA